MGHFGHRFSAFWPSLFSSFIRRELEAMEGTDDDQWIDVPERATEDLEIRADGDSTNDASPRWADIVENSSSSHMTQVVRLS